MAVARDATCPYLIGDNVLVTHITLSHEVVGVEVSILSMQNAFSHQESVVEEVNGDTVTVAPGGFVGGSHLVHKATVRMNPLAALDAAAAILQHLKGNGLVSDDALFARLALAGVKV